MSLPLVAVTKFSPSTINVSSKSNADIPTDSVLWLVNLAAIIALSLDLPTLAAFLAFKTFDIALVIISPSFTKFIGDLSMLLLSMAWLNLMVTDLLLPSFILGLPVLNSNCVSSWVVNNGMVLPVSFLNSLTTWVVISAASPTSSFWETGDVGSMKIPLSSIVISPEVIFFSAYIAPVILGLSECLSLMLYKDFV